MCHTHTHTHIPTLLHTQGQSRMPYGNGNFRCSAEQNAVGHRSQKHRIERAHNVETKEALIR